VKRIEARELNENGFSLIEILIAILILSLSILGIMAVFPTSYRHITSSGRISTINHLAQWKIDELRGTSFSDPDLTAGIHTSALTSPYADYSVSWDVTFNAPQANMRSVTVTVTYNGAQDPRSANFTLYLN
jgi:prepilin-type N-terminal cleavage/methylation domain-containing protein